MSSNKQSVNEGNNAGKVMKCIEECYKGQINLLKDSLEKQENEFQKRIALKTLRSKQKRIRVNSEKSENSLTNNTETSSAEASPDEITKRKENHKYIIVKNSIEDAVEELVKSWIANIGTQVEQIEDERDKAMEELNIQFQTELNELEFKLNTKYEEAKGQAEKLPERIRQASLKVLEEKHKTELVKEKNVLEDRQKAKKQKFVSDYRYRLRNLTYPESTSELVSKIKDTVKTPLTYMFSPIDTFPLHEFPLVSAFSLNESNYISRKGIVGNNENIKKYVVKTQITTRGKLTTVDVNLRNATEVLNSLYINTCNTGSVVQMKEVTKSN